MDDSVWVFDSLIGFLQGPIWSTPLLTFIEEKCIIFEPESYDKDFKDIYQEYKNLVDLLLGCYMEDMGITPEQFERACLLNCNTRIPMQFQQSLFEQIWAANEYEVFKRMMIQKNLELQLQTLSIIEQKKEITPEAVSHENIDSIDSDLVKDDCKNQIDEIQDNSSSDVDQIEPVQDNLKEEQKRLKAEYKNVQILQNETLKKSNFSELSEDKLKKRKKSLLDTIIDEKDEELEISNQPIVQVNPFIDEKDEELEISNQPIVQVNPMKPSYNEQDAKSRQNYLKQQRDKLVALKKKARNVKFEKNSSRPSSAQQAARAAIDGNKQEISIPQGLEPSILQVRKVLAARLKAEVVDK